MSRPTYIHISLDNLKDNYDTLVNKTTKPIMGVVKANAYGHGDIEISRFLQELGTPFLCVSSMDEAQRLAQAGITQDILIFGYVSPEEMINENRDQFVYTITSMKWYQEYKQLNIKRRVHLEINSGMNRVGIKHTQDILTILKNIEVEGIYTHFQSVGDIQRSKEQEKVFNNILEQIPNLPKWIHFGNAPLSIIKDNPYVNISRLGLGIYGYRVDAPELKPVLSLYSEIIHTDTIEAGESIGYDETYIYPAKGLFGTVPIGYADGILPNQHDLPFYIQDTYTPIVGKICMDQTMIDIPTDTQKGTTVEVMGPHRTLTQISNASEVSIYIILSSLSFRLMRKYYMKDQCIATTTY